MVQPTRILHLEDDPADRELILAHLHEGGISCRVTWVQSGGDYEAALRRHEHELILADYRLPGYDGIAALRSARELCPDVPFLFVSGTMGEDAAIEGLTEGATDYVLKTRLSRLVPAVRRVLREAENRRGRKRAEEAFRKLSRAVEQSPTQSSSPIATATSSTPTLVSPGDRVLNRRGQGEEPANLQVGGDEPGGVRGPLAGHRFGAGVAR